MLQLYLAKCSFYKNWQQCPCKISKPPKKTIARKTIEQITEIMNFSWYLGSAARTSPKIHHDYIPSFLTMFVLNSRVYAILIYRILYLKLMEIEYSNFDVCQCRIKIQSSYYFLRLIFVHKSHIIEKLKGIGAHFTHTHTHSE